MSVSAFGALSGTGPQQVWVHMWLSDQKADTNQSIFGYEVRYYGNGYGTYSGSIWSWSANIAGVARSGTFNIPFAERHQTYHSIGSGTVTVDHDSAGNLSQRRAVATITTDHTSVGSGSATTEYMSVTRISKPPTAPGTPTASGLGPKSATLSWTAPTNNNGSAVDGYQVQVSKNSNMSSPVIDETQGNTLTKALTTLDPATEYFARVRAKNNSYGQWGAWSEVRSFRTLSGAYVGVGGSLLGAEVLVGKAGSYVTVLEVRVGKDGEYVLAG